MRIFIVQHGIVICLAHIAGLPNTQSFLAESILKQYIKIDELKWTLKMIHEKIKQIGNSARNESLNRMTSLTLLKKKIELSEYFDMWNGKSLILSE